MTERGIYRTLIPYVTVLQGVSSLRSLTPCRVCRNVLQMLRPWMLSTSMKPRSIVTGNGRMFYCTLNILVSRPCDSQPASQEICYLPSSFARKELWAKDAQHRITYLYEVHTDNVESQMLLFRCFRAATGEYICRSPFSSTRFWNAWLSLGLLAMSVNHKVFCQTSVLQRNSFLCRGRLASALTHTHGQLIFVWLYLPTNRTSMHEPRNI